MDRRAFLAALAAAGGAALTPRVVAAGRGTSGNRRPGAGTPSPSLEAVVLGTVQDAGLPQPACYTDLCDHGRELARRGEPRLVASLALVQSDPERFYLVDATPDITRQIDLLTDSGFRRRAAARDPFDGIFLTHAHVGHYLGLALLGNEGTGISDTPVFCTAAMARFLESNGPWSLMVEQGRIVPTPLAPADPEEPVDGPDGWHRIDEGLEVKLLSVPHRDEYADTVAFVFRGPGGSLLYLPDIDSWDAWDRDVAEVVGAVDVALLDASFHSLDELPGRSAEEVPHPLVPWTMDRLEGVGRVLLTHLNNSNPLLLPDGPERARVVARGFEVAREGMRISL